MYRQNQIRSQKNILAINVLEKILKKLNPDLIDDSIETINFLN